MKRIQVTKSSLPPIEEYISEIESIWESSWLTNMGDKHKKLERELMRYLEVPNITLFNNGHLALEVAIQALDLKGEIITTPFTFASTTHAIVRSGLSPVFCDIKPNDFTIDPSKIEALITDRTCAILPVHVYGNVCDVYEIDRIAKKHNLVVIYDAAHAFGVKIDGKNIGTFGDVSMFSFHATKVFNTIEGGALTFNNSEFKKKFDNFKNFGIESEDQVTMVGMNAKMNEFQAAMGLCNLKYIDENIISRRKIAERYVGNLRKVVSIDLPILQQDFNNSNFSYFPILLKDTAVLSRDQLYNKLKAQGIMSRKYFYPLVNNFECYKNQFTDIKLPVAELVSSSILTLPLYPNLSFEDVDMICEFITSWV